jgi:hypothetical protein
LDGIDCGLARGAGALAGFFTEAPSTGGASLERGDWREKSGIPRGDFRFI